MAVAHCSLLRGFTISLLQIELHRALCHRNERLIYFILDVIHKCIFVLNEYHCKGTHNSDSTFLFSHGLQLWL